MRRFPRQYLGPLIAGLLLFAASCAWAWLYWGSILLREEDQGRRTAESLAASLTPLLDPGACPVAGDDAALGRLVEDRLEIRPPIVYALLLREGHRLASMGRIPPDLPSPDEPGMAPDGSLRVLAVAVGARPDPDRPRPPPDRPGPPPDRPARGPARRDPPPDRPDGGPPGRVDWRWNAAADPPETTLVVGVDARIGPRLLRKTVPEIAFALLVGWAGIAALVLAWFRSIRSRELARQLDVERRERSRLEEMNLAAAGLAHETKNPLGIILGLAQRIARDPQLASETREAAQHIIDAADQASARVSDFLGFARIPRPRLEAVQADQVLGRVVAALRPDFDDAGVRLDVHVPDDRIVCTPSMLEQVLMNLLLNSLQSSDRDTVVTLRLEPRGTTARLVVEDQGRGIPASLLPDIFKPYVTSRADGHGLGLAIVKRIVDQHGWTIGIESVEGQGTRVTIAGIPLRGTRRTTA